MIERLARYVAIPSLSKSEAELADAVASEMSALGLRVRRSGHNVWCETGDADRPRLLWNSHLDTVPPGDGWTGDPWTPRVGDGRLVGLGANDAKGCVVALIEAFLRLHAAVRAGAPLGGTIVLALTAEEENSGAGLGTVLDQLDPLDAALVGEPTGLTPMIAQRGLLIVRGVSRGRTGHPANVPMTGRENAIVEAARDLVALSAFDWGEVHPLLGRCHAHPTRIGGGIANNVVPDACEYLLDIRTTPLESHASLLARLKSALRAELSVHSDRLVPVETSAGEPIVRAVCAALPGAVPAGSPAMSDLVHLPGVPSVKIGPGDTRRSHTADEYVLASELSEAADAYERIALFYFALAGAAHDAVREGVRSS